MTYFFSLFFSTKNVEFYLMIKKCPHPFVFG